MDILLLRHALIKRQPTDEPKKENFTDSVSSFAKSSLLGIFEIVKAGLHKSFVFCVQSNDITRIRT